MTRSSHVTRHFITAVLLISNGRAHLDAQHPKFGSWQVDDTVDTKPAFITKTSFDNNSKCPSGFVEQFLEHSYRSLVSWLALGIPSPSLWPAFPDSKEDRFHRKVSERSEGWFCYTGLNQLGVIIMDRAWWNLDTIWPFLDLWIS